MNRKFELKLLGLMVFATWLIHFCTYGYFGPGALGLFLFPIFLAYCLRVFFTPVFSAHFVTVVFLVLNLISEVKYSFTKSVLSIQDFFFLNQAADVHDFLPVVELVTIGLTLATLFIPYKKWQPKLRYAPLAAGLALGLYFYQSSLKRIETINAWSAKYAGIQVGNFNPRDNIRGNGIFVHLAQTLALGTSPAVGPHSFYIAEKSAGSKNKNFWQFENYDIFLISIESAYFENDPRSLFYNDFSRLVKDGFTLGSMVSPSYGGNTSEAEFEIVTGLPARGLPGVKFQLYGSNFSPKALTFPALAKAAGYKAYYYHNTSPVHWNRDVAMKKFGYDRMFFIKDMNYPTKVLSWVRDSYLYNTAAAQYEKDTESEAPVFNQLMTVYSHGIFQEENNDAGIAHYNEKVRISMDDFFAFQEKVRKIAAAKNRKVLFIMMGDHKPGMNKAFFVNKTFPADFYMAGPQAMELDNFSLKDNLDGPDDVTIGRVPLFVKVLGSSRSEASHQMVKALDNKPLYCLPGFLAGEIARGQSRYYSRLSELCHATEPHKLADELWQRTQFAPELFAEVLFTDHSPTGDFELSPLTSK